MFCCTYHAGGGDPQHSCGGDTPRIDSIEQIAQWLRVQANLRAPENDEGGILQDLADDLLQRVKALEGGDLPRDAHLHRWSPFSGGLTRVSTEPRLPGKLKRILRGIRGLFRPEKGSGISGVEGSAEAVDEILRRFGRSRADYIISGIPFSTIPPEVRERILQKTCEALKPRGAFLVYQFSTRVLQDLMRIFGYVGRGFELLNVLPAHLFFCRPARSSR